MFFKIIKLFLVVCFLMLINFGIGFYKGRQSAFSDIILEKCWLNETSRDIECISFIH